MKILAHTLKVPTTLKLIIFLSSRNWDAPLLFLKKGTSAYVARIHEIFYRDLTHYLPPNFRLIIPLPLRILLIILIFPFLHQ